MKDLELKLPKETKNEFGYTPSEEKVIEKQMTRPSPPKNLWKNFVKASGKTDNKEEALAQALIESNRLAESESPKATWDRLEANEKKRVKLVRKEIDAKAADKKHLTKLYIHGMEHGQEPVIKNPIMRKALEAKPKKSVNYLSDNYSFEENFKKQSKNIKDYKPTANKPFKTLPKIKPGEPVNIDFKPELTDTGPTLTLEQHMAKVAPREIDAPGITGLDGVRSFRRSFDIANSKYPNKGKGIGHLLGEDN